MKTIERVMRAMTSANFGATRRGHEDSHKTGAEPLHARRRVRRLVALQLAAAGLAYALAWALGGGFAAAPFPPLDEVVVTHAAPVRASADAGARAKPVEPADSHAHLPAQQEVAPPWSFDSSGRIRLREW